MVGECMDNTDIIAHVRKTKDDQWDSPHLLVKHLNGTAEMAGEFAKKFGSQEWGKAAGIAHDAGKGRPEWQRYLRLKSGYSEDAHLEGKPGKLPHAIYGAKLVEDIFGRVGRVLSYCIAGHHAGLPDWTGAEGAGRSALEFQLAGVKGLETVYSFILDEISSSKPTSLPRAFSPGLDLSLWIRMLYSCLVDADFLDTESYMNQEKKDTRGGYLSIPELLIRLEAYNQELERTSADTVVNRIRRDVRAKCVDAAKEVPGFFSLTVPTGGGKTLSSLAFALGHAKEHGLERIIYVIPYTSIIEQNADVFRKAIGNDQVVEHHSSLDEEDSTPKSRLAAENWDAPIIVTTTVQFFESLFAAKSSRCRKLHNIINSVVILDEAQLVPIEFLAPILETMQLLVDHYRVSIVVSTATQPAFGEDVTGGEAFKGLKNVREIIGLPAQVNDLYRSLKRVTVKLPEDFHIHTNWEDIATELQSHEQVLCVVSDRKSCRTLYRLMPQGTYHLSALMCGKHRSVTINQIKERLNNNKPVRVVSTQLVEAGVDLDFPVVYRALAGLDSIAQAAGRCNREGVLPEGTVIVFVAPKKAPPGILRKAADTTVNVLSTTQQPDPLEQSIFKKFFAELYWKAASLDEKEIISTLNPSQIDLGIHFRAAAKNFRIIDDSRQKTILVRYGDSEKLIDELKYGGPRRELLRMLQRYTVNVYNDDFYLMKNRGSLEEVQPNIFALTASTEYSPEVGLMIDDLIFDPEDLIV